MQEGRREQNFHLQISPFRTSNQFSCRPPSERLHGLKHVLQIKNMFFVLLGRTLYIDMHECE